MAFKCQQHNSKVSLHQAHVHSKCGVYMYSTVQKSSVTSSFAYILVLRSKTVLIFKSGFEQ